jgi:heme exporter protein A
LLQSLYVAQMTGPGQIISLTDVRCIRGGRVLLSGLTFALSAGEAALVTGPNGVGKSTLLRLICGLFDAGNKGVQVKGRCALSDDRLALDHNRSLSDALSFWANADGGSAGASLEAMGLSHLADVPVRMLSTGQRKRASLARVVASNAPIWLLDEPANGLDDDGMSRMTRAIADHRSGGGVAIVTSHQPLNLPGALSIRLEPPCA